MATREQIAAHIQSTRGELGENLQELQSKVRDATDWRVQFARHPVAFLGGAFACGALLSVVLSGPRNRNRAIAQTTVAPGAAEFKEASKSSGANVWSDIKGALGSAVGTQVYSLLGHFIPGIQDQAARRRQADRAGTASAASRRNGHEPTQGREPPLD